MWEAGDVVLVRSIFGGNVRWTFPHRYVGDWAGRHGLYCGPGNEGKVMRRGSGAYLQRWLTDAPPFDTEWAQTHVLRFARAGDRYTIEIFWTEDWRLRGWYVNLQTPTVIRDHLVDTTDLVLDIVVEPDGTWRWKDEHELEQAIMLGILDQGDARALRAVGERVIRARPWPTGWESWRPPEDWGPLQLPTDWHLV